MIKLFYTLFFLVLSSSSVSGVGLARLIQEESFAKDRLFGGLEINLKLSQGIPYKINFLEKPLSLIIDFNVLSFDGKDLQKLNLNKNIKLTRFEKLNSKWSRLSIQFQDYWNIENTEMRIDPNDSSAVISILLNSVTEDDFKSKNVNAGKLLQSDDLGTKEITSATNNSEFIVVLDPGHGGKDPGA